MYDKILFSAVAVFAVVIACVVFYRFWFLRKPVRSVPGGDVVVSPASGKVVRIVRFGGRGKSIAKADIRKGLLGRVGLLVRDVAYEGFMVVIVMTPLDVHYQRSPVSGTVESTRYSMGRFINAVDDAASLRALENEKNEIMIKNRRLGKVKVVQVAGFLARRISCFVEKKQKIHKGAELGLISLGSQVILVVPRVELLVREGQRVVDGETVIARF